MAREKGSVWNHKLSLAFSTLEIIKIKGIIQNYEKIHKIIQYVIILLYPQKGEGSVQMI